MSAWKDGTFWGMALVGAAFLIGALLIQRMDAAFLAEAIEADAVVVDKDYRPASRNADGSTRDLESRSIRYEWLDPDLDPPMTWSGEAPYSAGPEAFDALVLGQSTVRLAWRRIDDGRSVDSRLLEDGFTGVPWPLLILGLVLLLTAPVRLIWLLRRGAVSKAGHG